MSFICYCPYCDQKIECENEDEGSKAPCPACHEVIFIKKECEKSQVKVIRESGPAWSYNPSPVAPVPPVPSASPQAESSGFAGYVPPVYKRPVLACIFMVIAFVHWLAAFFSFLVIVYFIENEQTGINIISAVAGLFVSILLGVLWSGLAQFVSFIAKISTNSEAIRRLLELNYFARK